MAINDLLPLKADAMSVTT